MTASPQRIAVVGSGGSGKSTFADLLGSAMGLPVHHLDEHFWQPGWQRVSDDEWHPKQRELAAADRWIIDGNHGSTLDIRFERADTVVFLDIPRRTCLRGIFWRHFFSPKLQADGCPNRLDRDFLTWVWQFPKDSRERLLEGFARHPHLRVVTITRRRQIPGWIAQLSSDLEVGQPASVNTKDPLKPTEGQPTTDG